MNRMQLVYRVLGGMSLAAGTAMALNDTFGVTPVASWLVAMGIWFVVGGTAISRAAVDAATTTPKAEP